MPSPRANDEPSPRASDDRRRTGRRGEEIACRHLQAIGMRLLERNARTAAGEIDVIALEGRTIVFVEVKTTRPGNRRGPTRPELAVGPRKQRRVRRLARGWLARATPPPHAALRFDVIGVELRDDGHGVLRHLRDAF